MGSYSKSLRLGRCWLMLGYVSLQGIRQVTSSYMGFDRTWSLADLLSIFQFCQLQLGRIQHDWSITGPLIIFLMGHVSHVSGGCLGAGRGSGSCPAPPFRTHPDNIHHLHGCPPWAECCTEYGFCHSKVEMKLGNIKYLSWVNNYRVKLKLSVRQDIDRM